MKADGFSLVEALVATAIVIVGLVSLAQLLVVSADAVRNARAASIALLLAEQKLEELRAETAGPEPSPPGVLREDTPGYVEYIDPVYTRRWSVEQIPGSQAIVLQVLVIPGGARLVTVKTRRAR